MLEPQLIIYDKPAGVTSHDVVDQLRRDLRESTGEHHLAVGHAGTLDPFATGVLIILVGRAVKAQSFFLHSSKTYRAIIQFGSQTDTGDPTGVVINEAMTAVFSRHQIEAALRQLTGKLVQAVPLYAAAKVDGRKLYEYARAKQEPPRRPIRVVNISRLELISYDPKNHQLELEVDCSSGTYIRALAEQIAQRLGTIGYLISLRRLRVGHFVLEDTIA